MTFTRYDTYISMLWVEAPLPDVRECAPPFRTTVDVSSGVGENPSAINDFGEHPHEAYAEEED